MDLQDQRGKLDRKEKGVMPAAKVTWAHLDSVPLDRKVDREYQVLSVQCKNIGI